MSDSSYLMFCGSYTDFDILAHLPKTKKVGKGVYVYHFHNGEIKPLSVIPSLNPAVLSFHPTDPHTVYILAEGIKENGVISKLQYDYTYNAKTKRVEQLEVLSNDESHAETGGKSLCYFKVDPVSLKYGVAINYWDGSVDVFAMNQDKAKRQEIVRLHEHIDIMKLSKSLQTEQEAAKNPRRQVTHREDHWEHRQVGPHAHSVHYYKQWVFVPDLGENSILQYSWNPDKQQVMKYEAQLKLTEGAGPRHMVFHPQLKTAYVSNELNSSITVLEIDDSEPQKEKCRLKIIQEINTDKDMKVDNDIWARNYVAEIGISHDGKFVYCSNRGYDTIAVFKVLLQKKGTLQNVSFVPTFGKTPRHFAITPDDKYLVGANQDSNNVIVFKRDRKNGTLEVLKKYEDVIAAPNYVLFTPFNVAQNVKAAASKSSEMKRESTMFTPVYLVLLVLAVGVLLKLLL